MHLPLDILNTNRDVDFGALCSPSPALGARSGPKEVVIQVGQMVTSLISIHVR